MEILVRSGSVFFWRGRIQIHILNKQKRISLYQVRSGCGLFYEGWIRTRGPLTLVVSILGRLTQNNVTKAFARETLSFVTSIENTYNTILTEYILYTLFIKITKFKQKTSRAV